MGTPSSNLFLPQSLLYINTLFSPLHETLYANHIKLFAEGLEFFVHAVSQLIVSRKTASNARFIGAKRFNFSLNASRVALYSMVSIFSTHFAQTFL
jgi:hypothetical protein